MSANRVEWHALECGFSVERVTHDYGVDLLLIVYDAAADVAYWVHLQESYRQTRRRRLELVGETDTIHIPTSAVVDAEAIREFARIKNAVLARAQRVTQWNLPG